MTNKKTGPDLLIRIPDDTSGNDMVQDLEFVAAVRQGLSELDNGDGIPLKKLRKSFLHGL